ncbi:MAG: hypothetical protein L0G94_10650 [Brachybacterium sp.]|uniref:hypothetical protein n=1 Tax=Brachybacterium sp. TaxID=1891286 RepID=UPI0026481967|nr:hypothetical protein [Brachybacterium sp.]MDN5687115.1 hypothetical protein [Brachybacterium sp.]
MKVSDIVRIFVESDNTDWTRLDKVASAILPFPYWETGANGSRSAWITFTSYAVHNSHPDIQLLWGMDEDERPFEGRGQSPRSFPELPTWPNPAVRMENAVLLWHGMPVHQFYYLSVDGGRGIVPVPDVKAEEPGVGSTYQAYFLRGEFEKVQQLSFLDNPMGSPQYLDQVARHLPVVDHRDEVVFDADE